MFSFERGESRREAHGVGSFICVAVDKVRALGVAIIYATQALSFCEAHPPRIIKVMVCDGRSKGG